MPTAVITESSEKTMSSSMIWIDHAPERRAPHGPTPSPSSPSSFSWISCVLLAEQEEPADEQDQVATGDLLAQDGEERRGEADDPRQREQEPIRMNIASSRPM